MRPASNPRDLTIFADLEGASTVADSDSVALVCRSRELTLGRPGGAGAIRVKSVSAVTFAVGALVVGGSAFPAVVVALQVRLNEATTAQPKGLAR